MKSISITKSILLFMLFVTTGCNFNRNNNQGSKVQRLTDISSEENAYITPVRPSVRYTGEYSITTKEGEDYGTIFIYAQEGNVISFDLFIGMGTPPYHTGETSGEVEIVDGKGVFKNDEYGDCILDFVFTDNSVRISHQEGGYGCGFGMNVAVNGTFVKKSADASVIINEDLLWEIFMKIHADSIPKYLFKTVPERRQARVHKLFNNGYGENDKNRLIYDETDSNGNRIFMGLACYPTDDEKKIITLFYHGAGIDTYRTLSNQTYEYDIITGELKIIERPIDPYTEDEFLDESILTPKQISEMKKLFSQKDLFNHGGIDKDGFSVYFAAFEAFNDDWDKYGEYVQNIDVRRNWNGKRFVKSEKKSKLHT